MKVIIDECPSAVPVSIGNNNLGYNTMILALSRHMSNLDWSDSLGLDATTDSDGNGDGNAKGDGEGDGEGDGDGLGDRMVRVQMMMVETAKLEVHQQQSKARALART